MLKLEQNPKLGAYYVGNYSQPIYNKLHALEFSIKSGGNVRWDFNDSVYNKINWQQEPEIGIDMLYLMRARQLRDRYDYLVLNFSGGSDSTNILYTFLKNGIHIDEIITRHPASGLKNVKTNTQNKDATNQISEFDYAVVPRLKWVADNFPNIKITVHDYFESMVNESIDDNWIYAAREFFHPGVIKRFSNLSMRSQLAMYDKGKTVGVIYGIDKPKLEYHDGKYYAYFLDLHCNTVVSEVAAYTNITSELFYWTPDLPEIVVKQAHMVRRWLDINPHYRNLIHAGVKVNSEIQSTVERVVAGPVIYSGVEHDIFQGNKIGNAVVSEHDSWFWENHMDTNIAKIWRGGIETLKSKVPNYLRYNDHGQLSGVKLFKSPLYQLN
jgi:hypothetical protein